MTGAEVLADGFARVRSGLHGGLAGLAPEILAYRPDPQANTIAWLAWHLTRIEDAQVAELLGAPEIWESDGWAERFDLPLDAGATGYGQSPEEAASVEIDSVSLLTGYHDAVGARTDAYVSGLSDADLDRVVDRSYDPPVTVGARLVSVTGDALAHLGQAAYLRGVAERSSR